MKKLIYIAVVLLLGSACKKEGLLTYDITDNIYFAYKEKRIVQNPIIDTTNFTFAYSPLSVTDSMFQLPVAVTGLAKDRDRTFSITVNAASSAAVGKHYEMPATFVLRAGRLTDTILIKLKRPADLKSNPVSLMLDLKGDNTFGTNLKKFYGNDTVEALSFKINISDVIVAGSSWNGTFAPFFGTFSVKKVLLMNQVAGMPLNFFIDFNVGGINLNALSQYYAITTSRYLKDEAAAGRTVYEEDGVTLMAMAPAYQ